MAAQTLNITIAGQTEQHDGKWRATYEAFGLVAYGETAEEASRRLGVAANMYVDMYIKLAGSMPSRLGWMQRV